MKPSPNVIYFPGAERCQQIADDVVRPHKTLGKHSLGIWAPLSVSLLGIVGVLLFRWMFTR